MIGGVVLALFGLDSWISDLIYKYVLELPNTRTQELEGRTHPSDYFRFVPTVKVPI